VTIWYPI